jgi:hypothetical protein
VIPIADSSTPRGKEAMLTADAAAREASRDERKDGAVETATLELYEVIAHL